MKRLFIAFFLLASSIAHAEFDIPVSKIVNPDYFCGTTEGAYAIKVGKTPRLWQTDLNANGTSLEGIELKNVKLTTYRCLDCFALSGDLEIMGDAIHVKGEIKGTSTGIKLNLVMSNNEGESQAFPEMVCHKVSKNK